MCKSDVWSAAVVLWEIWSGGEEPSYIGADVDPRIQADHLQRGDRLFRPADCSTIVFCEAPLAAVWRAMCGFEARAFPELIDLDVTEIRVASFDEEKLIEQHRRDDGPFLRLEMNDRGLHEKVPPEQRRLIQQQLVVLAPYLPLTPAVFRRIQDATLRRPGDQVLHAMKHQALVSESTKSLNCSVNRPSNNANVTRRRIGTYCRIH